MLKFSNKFKKGYTLAEMLVVLGIFSLMMIAMPSLTKKMFKLETKAKEHGRLECYVNSTGHVIQYESVAGKTPIYIDKGEANGTNHCEFVPYSNSVYTMIHAVGAGGAGADFPVSEQVQVSKYVATSYLYYSAIGLWPEWFKYLSNNKGSELEFDADKFESKKTFMNLNVPYGRAGEAGERLSMFFPRLRGVTIKIYPGKAVYGGNGENTIVKFRYTGQPTDSEVMNAAGGKAATAVERYGVPLIGGKAGDYGVAELDAVKSKDSEFETVVEDSGIDTNHETRINVTTGSVGGYPADWSSSNKAGWGGHGGYYYFTNGFDGEYTYQVNNYYTATNASGEQEKMDQWRLVTKLIKPSFYSRNNSGAECNATPTSGKIQVTGWCVNVSGLDRRCKIDSIPKLQGTSDTYYELNVPGSEVLAGGLISSVPPGYNRCAILGWKKELVCEADSVSNARTICPSESMFAVLPGCSSRSINVMVDDSAGILHSNSSTSMSPLYCERSNGGNGAAIILW